MTTTLALTIWVASSQLALPITGAIARAAGESLGPGVTIQTAAFPDGRPDEVRPPHGTERSVQIAWTSAAHEGARLKLCRAVGACFERWVSFRSDDPELERGRTVGFLSAAVFLEDEPASGAKPASQPVVPPREPRGYVSAAVVVAAPGDGTGVGARLGASYAFLDSFRGGLALQARFGELSSAQATSRLSSALLVAELAPWRLTHAVRLGLDLDAGVYQLSVSHLSEDDPAPDRESRWLAGGDLAVELAVGLSDTAAIFVAPGIELLSGSTEVFVHHEVRATWPVVIPTLRVGLRAAFSH